ncbi:hypothetical protein FACS189438_3140 [Bacteroidia bacterium]|nr:hypothetical protein FACS189438_3140 [Bacteroidia bacterium]
MNKIDFHPKVFATWKNYSKERFLTDLMAGIIVGIVALPLAIAFGIASGVSPEQGLVTAIIGGFIVSFMGGSNVQIGGPTGAFIVIVYGIIQKFGIEGLAIATVMAGIMLVVMGVLKLGTIIRFIPYPIVVGFTSGIALTIFTTQIKDIFGLDVETLPADFLSKWAVYFENIQSMNAWPLLVGLLSIAIIVFTPRVSKKIPGSLVAILVMTLAAVREHIEDDLKQLQAPFGVYAVNGNHEYRANRFAKWKWIAKTGATLLSDSAYLPVEAGLGEDVLHFLIDA